MSIRAPGQECLTKTQTTQREFMAQLRQQQNAAPLQAPGTTATDINGVATNISKTQADNTASSNTRGTQFDITA